MLRRAAVEAIEYTTAPSPYGPMLVAMSSRGVCEVAFSDSAEQLLAGLKSRHPKATLTCRPLALAPMVRRVLAVVAGRASLKELPVDVDATEFERRVWDALRQIPPGETRTY